MSRIDSFNAPSFDNTGLQGRASSGNQAAVGQFAGQQVQVDGVDSMLSDAAEEIGQYLADKAETKHSAERKKEPSRALQTMNAEAIMAYLDQAKDQDGTAKLVQLAKRMLSGQGDPAQHARQEFGNPTSQYMGLQYALQQGERDGVAADVLDALRDALQDLEMVHGPAIRADINTVGTAGQAGSSRAEVVEFQTAYRDVVLGEATVNTTLKLVLERFGDKDFAVGLERLKQALGQDLAAANTSCSPFRLQSLMQDLYHLGVSTTVLDGCKELKVQMAERFGITSLQPLLLMRSLIEICAEKWISPQRFTSLSETCGATAIEPQIFFLTSVMGLLRDMPVQVFVDSDQRQSVLDACQAALDQAIEREEENY